MNSNTYGDVYSGALKAQIKASAEAAKAQAEAFMEILRTKVEIDEAVPDGMVRLAGNRYISREEFQRQLKRELRNR